MNLDTLITSCPDCAATLTHTADDDGRWLAECRACRWMYEGLPAPLNVRQALTSLSGFPALLLEVVRDLEAVDALRVERDALADAVQRDEAELRGIVSALEPFDVRAAKDPVATVRRLVARVVGVGEE